MSKPSGLVRIGIAGERSRRAQETLGRASTDLVLALKRVLPFLTRKRIGVTAEPPTVTLFAELDETVPDVAYTIPFVIGPARVRGLIAIDAQALSRILDGILGGGEPGASTLTAGSLSSAQKALASRVSVGILRGFAEAFRARLDLAVEASVGSAPTDAGVCAVLSLTVAGGGVLAIAVPVSALGEGDAAPQVNDGRIAAAMVDVEVDVVAELGKVRIPLATLAGLAVGDILQLSLPLDERARVCAGGAVLFRGRPTASGLTIGIAIERHAT